VEKHNEIPMSTTSKYIINTKQGKLDVTELVQYCTGRPDPDPLLEIIYYVPYCHIKADGGSLREDLLNDILELLYFVKSLIDTIHDIKRGAHNSLIVESFFDNYESTWGEEINNNYLQAMIHIASCLDRDDDNLPDIVYSMSQLQWIKEILSRTLKQPEECAEGG